MIFGSGSRAPVAITILVRNPDKKKHEIHYNDIGDYLSREQKLKTIGNAGSMPGLKGWEPIEPDKKPRLAGSARRLLLHEYLPIGK